MPLSARSPSLRLFCLKNLQNKPLSRQTYLDIIYSYSITLYVAFRFDWRVGLLWIERIFGAMNKSTFLCARKSFQSKAGALHPITSFYVKLAHCTGASRFFNFLLRLLGERAMIGKD